MKSITRLLASMLVLLVLATGPALAAEQAQAKHIDLVICIDTSNSMDGLIASAKAKLWDIVNDLAQVKPTPKLRVALYSFGNDGYDRKSGWIRKDLDLTDDLDQLYQKLFALSTRGGTEYATRVCRDAIDQLKWTEDAGALKMIFVCGNEPANQDKVVTMKAAGELAAGKGIVINTIFCGPENSAHARSWKEFAEASAGRFASINQNKGAVAVATPQDKKLAELSAKLNKTYVVYGKAELRKEKASNQAAQDSNARLAGAPVAAARAVSKSTALYNCAAWDLVDLVKQDAKSVSNMLQKDGKPIYTEEQIKKMKPDDLLGNIVKNIPEDQLSKELKELKPEERVGYIKKKAAARKELQEEIKTLNVKRNAYLADYMKKNASEADQAFGEAIRKTINDQATKKGFQVPKK